MTTEVETPDGYHWITPYFTVDEGDKLIAFLTAAFDAAVIKDNRYDNGRIQHARLRIGDSVIMLNEVRRIIRRTRLRCICMLQTLIVLMRAHWNWVAHR